MRPRRLLLAATFAVALVPLVAGPASAAPPGNDEYTGATLIHVGDQIVQDTTQATTNAGDATDNTNCGAPATNASVWFTYAPTTKGDVAFDSTASSYEAGLMVFAGTPSADSLLACGPGVVGLRAHAGVTYYVMAFSDTASVQGGNLVLSANNAPKPIVHATLAKHGVAYHGGAAQLHGTYSCRHGEGLSEVDAHLLQRAGRLKIQADAFTNITCDGKSHRYSVRLVSPVGTYAKGAAQAKVTIFACGVLQCSHQTIKHDVHLSWAKASNRAWMKHPTAGRTAHPLLWRQGHWRG